MNLEDKLREVRVKVAGGEDIAGILGRPNDGSLGASMPLPSAAGIVDMAYWNPRAALGIILGIPRVPIVMNAQGTFTSGAVSQVAVEAPLDTTITQETWIQRVNYSIVQPNAFAGNIFKPQFDYFFRFSSGILVQAEINSGPRYVTNIAPSPIENFADLLACNWPSGWPLFNQQSLRIFMQLSQPLPSVPLTCTVSFLGWQFIDRCIDRISDEYARAQLRLLGLNSPSLAALLEC